MKVNLFRCYRGKCSDRPGNMGFDFQLPKDQPPLCPKCRGDWRTPNSLVVRRKVLHFDAVDETTEQSLRQVVCDPSKAWVADEREGVTGDPAAVNCTDCQRTSAWQQAALAAKVIEEWDLAQWE